MVQYIVQFLEFTEKIQEKSILFKLTLTVMTFKKKGVRGYQTVYYVLSCFQTVIADDLQKTFDWLLMSINVFPPT